MNFHKPFVGHVVAADRARGLDERGPVLVWNGLAALHFRRSRRLHADRAAERGRPAKILHQLCDRPHESPVYMIRVDAANMTCVYILRDYRCMADMAERLRLAREDAGFLSARSAAQRYGWKESTYAAHENGQNGFKIAAARRYGRAFNVSPAWLLTGDPGNAAQNVAKVIGYIGAGGLVDPAQEQVPPEGLAEIEVPFPIPDGAVAFEVRGDSMWPRYDEGDVIICSESSRGVDQLLGWEAAVRTQDGQRYLKRVVRGSGKGLYDLESHNAPTLRSKRLEWIGEVLGVVRRGQWRTLDARGRQRKMRTIAR